MSVQVRRLRRVLVTPEFLVEMMKHGTPAVTLEAHALPDDAAYVGCTFDPNRLGVWIFVASPSFDEVAPNGIVPEHPAPVFRRVP